MRARALAGLAYWGFTVIRLSIELDLFILATLALWFAGASAAGLLLGIVVPRPRR